MAQQKPVAASTLAWIGPFVVFIACMAVEKMLPVPPQAFYPVRAALSLAAILIFSRRVISWAPTHVIGSIAMGVAVFVIWVGPDVVWPGWHHLWIFQNSLLGSPASSLPSDLKSNIWFLAVRVFGTAALVPVLEELFWRGWMMRWLIDQNFSKVLLGTYTAFSFWITALLFASEHGSYWDVGLITGAIYGWWLVRTRNLPNCILAHAVTNACLAAYVLAAGKWQYWL